MAYKLRSSPNNHEAFNKGLPLIKAGLYLERCLKKKIEALRCQEKMCSHNIEDDEVRRAIGRFEEDFGSEVTVKSVCRVGRIIEIKFLGEIRKSPQDTNNYAQILEKIFRMPYAVWNYEKMELPEPQILVRFVKLDFLDEIRHAMKEVSNLVKKRIRAFEKTGMKESYLFKELCFCLLTANFSAEGGIKIQEAIDDGFLMLSREALIEKLRKLGHRYPRTRAEYIVEARKHYGRLCETIRTFNSPAESREWLVKNVKGLGYKEASHFLRNTGSRDVAIIDRHILRFLDDKKLISDSTKSLNRNKYLKLEKLLSTIASKLKLSVGELDLYIWYIRTGKVLK